MLKRILTSVLFLVAFSSATWNYFPIQGSGVDVKGGYALGIGDAPQSILVNARAYYEAIEISIQNWGVQFTKGAGITYPTLGVRFQIQQRNLIFLDWILPFGSRDEYTGFHVGVQQGLILTKRFAWGLEIGYINYFAKESEDSEFDPKPRVSASTEMDINFFPELIFFAGGNLWINITSGDYKLPNNSNFGNASSITFAKVGDVESRIFFGASYKLDKSTAIEEEISTPSICTGYYENINYLTLKTSIKKSF